MLDKVLKVSRLYLLSNLSYRETTGGGNIYPPALRRLTRAREWGPELRAREGGGAESDPPANSAPMTARITNFYGRYSG